MFTRDLFGARKVRARVRVVRLQPQRLFELDDRFLDAAGRGEHDRQLVVCGGRSPA